MSSPASPLLPWRKPYTDPFVVLRLYGSVRAAPQRPECSYALGLEGGAMTTIFTSEQRQLQDRFDTRRLADRIEELLVTDTIGERERRFIEARDMFFLASCDAEG